MLWSGTRVCGGSTASTVKSSVSPGFPLAGKLVSLELNVKVQVKVAHKTRSLC